MIESIELRNFRSHGSTSLRFGPGTNVIVGVMGSGKSSAMDGLCFGLYGTFPALKSRRIQLSGIVRGYGEEKEKTSVVSVKFSAQGSGYSVTRKVSAEGTEAFLRKGGELVEGPAPQRVNEAVGQLVGIDYDTFARTAYAEQNRIDYFLALGRGERKKQLDELLGIDRLERARQALSTVQNRLAASAAAQTAASESLGNPEEMEKEAQKKEQEVQEVAAQTGRLLQKAEEAEKRYAQKNAELARARTAREEIGKLRVSLEGAAAAIAANRVEMNGRLQRAAKLRAECASKSEEDAKREFSQSGEKATALEGELVRAAGAHSKAAGAAAQKARLSNQIGQIRERMASVLAKAGEAANLDELKSVLEKTRSELKGAESQGSSASALLERVRAAKNALQKAAAECPVCKRPLSEHAKRELDAEMEKEMADLEKIEKTAGERSAMLARDESLQRKSLEEFSGLQARLRSFEDECAEASKEAGKERQTKTEMEDAREKIRENAKKIESLANVLNAHRNLLAETEAAESLERSVARQEESRAKAELRLSEMERAPGARDGEFEMLEPWERALREELYGTKSALQGAKSREEAARKELDLLKGMIKKAGDAAELARKTNEKVTKAKLLQNALVEVQEGLRAQLVSAVNESLAASWGEVYPYRDYSSARLKPAADDYELQLQEGGGEWVGADHASGGEKSIAALCLRMAFARVLAPSLGLLILDEPTHNLDEAGTAALSEALRRGAGEGGAFEQIFIITHDDALREAAEGALYSFERGKTGVAGDATAAVDLSERENG